MPEVDVPKVEQEVQGVEQEVQGVEQEVQGVEQDVQEVGQEVEQQDLPQIEPQVIVSLDHWEIAETYTYRVNYRLFLNNSFITGWWASIDQDEH